MRIDFRKDPWIIPVVIAAVAAVSGYAVLQSNVTEASEELREHSERIEENRERHTQNDKNIAVIKQRLDILIEQNAKVQNDMKDIKEHLDHIIWQIEGGFQ